MLRYFAGGPDLPPRGGIGLIPRQTGIAQPGHNAVIAQILGNHRGAFAHSRQPQFQRLQPAMGQKDIEPARDRARADPHPYWQFDAFPSLDEIRTSSSPLGNA